MRSVCVCARARVSLFSTNQAFSKSQSCNEQRPAGSAAICQILMSEAPAARELADKLSDISLKPRTKPVSAGHQSDP